jgi:16S rRNA G1207 methylase RsmC
LEEGFHEEAGTTTRLPVAARPSEQAAWDLARGYLEQGPTALGPTAPGPTALGPTALGPTAQSKPRVLATTVGRAQAARGLALLPFVGSVDAWLLDLYRMQQAQADASADGSLSRVAWHCTEDLPDNGYEVALLPTDRSGESELARELVQAMHERLCVGGVLFASVNHREDQWLADVVGSIFKTVRRHVLSEAVVYQARKDGALKKRKSYECTVRFRDGERVLSALSRPGVFSHRKVDAGARHLLAATVPLSLPGARVLELGCGSGIVSLGIASRDPTMEVVALDSNARAVACTRRGAQALGLANVEVLLNADGGREGMADSFDVVVGNPPYYAQLQIASRFIDAAWRNLRGGGSVIMVTKHPQWFEEAVARRRFVAVVVEDAKGYAIIRGRKPTAG